MTPEQRIAHLEAELARERAEKDRLMAMLESFTSKKRTAGAERQARYRERQKPESVTSDVTATRDGDVSRPPLPSSSPPPSFPLSPPSEPSPSILYPFSPASPPPPPSASQASAAAPPPVLVVQEAAPEKPKRAPSTTAMGEFIDWARAEVKPRLPPDALDPAAGMKPHERVRLGEAVKDHGLESVKAAFRLFMGWAVAESKGYSVGFFANQWETWVRQAKATVAPAGRPNAVGRGAEGPARECAGCGEETGEGQQHGQTWVGLYCGCGAALFRLATPPADVGQWARNRRAGRAA